MADLDRLLGDCHRLLIHLTEGAVVPAEAMERFNDFRAERPEVDLTLIWETEEADGSISYDILIRDGVGTVSLAVTLSRRLPWPLRGVTRAREHDLVMVGRTRLSVADALAELDFVWDRTDLLRRLVDTCIVGEELAREPLDVLPAQIQACADAYRRSKGLLASADMVAWLHQRGMSEDRFASLMTRVAALRALRRRVAGNVDAWWQTHHARFDLLTVAWAVVPAGSVDRHPLRELAQFGDDEVSALASVAEAIRAGRSGGVTRWRASDAPVELSGAQVGATQIAVIEGERAVTRVLARDPANLDRAVRTEIEKRTFEDWLTERRSTVEIEWFWGDGDRTSIAR